MTPFPTQWRTGARPSSLVALLLVAAALPVTPAASQTVRGHLLDAGNDQPVGLGLIVLLTESGDSVASTLTDERGYFSLTSPDPGSFHLQASALGYGDATDGVFELALGAEMTVEFRVSPEPLPMDALLASVNRPVVRHQLIRNGFLHRFQRNVGGHFITPYDIERSPATATEELLQDVPGLRVGPSIAGVARPGQGDRSFLGEAVQMRSPRGGWCTPSLVIDGVRVSYDRLTASGRSLSAVAPRSTVAAVEVYRRPAEVPIRYNATRASSSGACGVVVLWTREGR